MSNTKENNLEKYYTVFASLNNNLSPVIKSFFSKRSSLAMSAYISDVPREGDKVYEPKDSRDSGEVDYIGLLLPETIPDEVLNVIFGDEEKTLQRVRDFYPYIAPSEKVGDCFLIRDPNVISRFWVMNDEHMKTLAKQYGKFEGSEDKPKVRLYYTNVLALPAAEKHFPIEMGLTREDLVEVTQLAILELYYNTYLKDGYAVELSRHKNKQNIDHVHSLMPAMRFKYAANHSQPQFNESEFIAWLSRNQHGPLKKRLAIHEAKIKYWEEQVIKYPSQKNEQTLEKWKKTFEKTELEYADLQLIIARRLTNGSIWEKYKTKYIGIQQHRFFDTDMSASIFSKYKNNVEIYHDNKDFLYKFKLQFADLLNKHLAKAKIIHPGRKLFWTHKPVKMFISIKEAMEYKITKEAMAEVNKLINSLRQFNNFNYFYTPTEVLKNKEERRRLVVHLIRRQYMQSFDKNRKSIATSIDRAQQWVNKWRENIIRARDHYDEMVKSFIDISIYDMSWKPSKVDRTIFTVDKTIVDYKPVLKRSEGKEVVVVNESHGAYLGQDQGLNAYSADALIQPKKQQQNLDMVEPPVDSTDSLVDYFFDELKSLKLWLDKSDGFYKIILPEGERHLKKNELVKIMQNAKKEGSNFLDAYDMFFEKQHYQNSELQDL